MAKSDAEKIDLEAARREIASSDAIAVDVRSEEEFQEGHVPGAIHLPEGDASAGTKEPEPGSRLIVIAKNGKLAVKAASALGDRGYDAVAVDAGMDDWVSEDFNIQPTEDPDEETELGLD
jgi:rhodanese-related sulfurtransferase